MAMILIFFQIPEIVFIFNVEIFNFFYLFTVLDLNMFITIVKNSSLKKLDKYLNIHLTAPRLGLWI